MKNIVIYLEYIPGMGFEGKVTQEVLDSLNDQDRSDSWVTLKEYFSDGSSFSFTASYICAIIEKKDMKFGEQKYA